MMNALRPLLLGLAAAVVLAGCPAATTPPPEIPLPPQIETFTASAGRVKAGTAVTLTWETKNASEVKIDNLALGVVSGVEGESGTVEVTVNESSVFVLSAKNSRGVRESAAVSVEVEEGTREVLFAATPRAVAAGEPVTLAWIADGAKSVSLRVKGGEALAVGDQLSAGHLSVQPTDHTTWELTVDGTVYETSVQVRPAILLVTSNPTYVLPGEDVTVQWVTLGATRVTVEAVGRGQVHETSQPGQAAEGSFTEQVAPSVEASDVVSYLVRAHGANDAVVTGKLELYVGGTPLVEQFTAPEWVNEGAAFPITWRTLGADVVELTADGVPVYRSQTAAEAANGTLTVDAPGQATTYRLTAIYLRGGAAHSDPRLVSPIGPPAFVSFDASPTGGIPNGGDPVVLSWNVTNARNVRIVAVGGRTVLEQSGPSAAQGTVTAFPNKNTTYRLVADNGAGLTIPAEELQVSVDVPATLTFSPVEVPVGATVQLTGASVPGVTSVNGLPAVRNLPGTAFEDIAQNGGVSIGYGGPDTTAMLVQISETFTMPYFGGTLSGDHLNISINGWFAVSNSQLNGPDVATPFPSGALLPNAFGPLMEDLRDVNGEIYWRLDTVNGVRRLIVQWENVQIDLNNSAQNGTSLTFQAQLYADGRVVYAYGLLSGITTQRPSVGLQSTAVRGLDAPVVPQSNETISFFHSAPVPVEIIAGNHPFSVTVASPTFDLDVDSPSPILAPGQFTISEVNHNPAPGQQQWFEVRNNASTPRDLQGWTIDFGGGVTHEIASSVVLPANGLLVFGETTNATEGGQVDYAYGAGLTVPAAAGSLGLQFAGVRYTSSSWTAAGTPGVATQIETGTGLTMAGSSVGSGIRCAATQSYGATGQLGTPGVAHPRCFQYTLQRSSPHAFQSILATGTVPSTFTASFDEEVAGITLPRPIPLFGTPRSQVWISANGFISVSSLADSYYTNATAVDPAAPNGILAPFWDDLVGRSGAGVRWQQFDPDGIPASGDEYTLFSWENATLFLQTATLNFQVRVDEGSGAVHFLYGTMTSTDSGGARARGSSATTLIENVTGTAAAVHNINSTSPGVTASSGLRFAFNP